MRSETSGEVGVPATNSVQRKYLISILNTRHRGEVQGCLKKNVEMGRNGSWCPLIYSKFGEVTETTLEVSSFRTERFHANDVVCNTQFSHKFSFFRAPPFFQTRPHTWNIPRAARVPPTLLPRATQPTFDRSSPFQLPAQLSKSTEWKVCRSHELLR